MEECVEYGLQHNPRVRAAEFAVQRSGAEVRAAFADFLPRVDGGFQRRYLRQVSSGFPPAEEEPEENGEDPDNGEADEQGDEKLSEAGEGTRLLKHSLKKHAAARSAPSAASATRSASTKQNETVPAYNPFEELQQQLDQINQGLSQQNQNLASLDQNLSNLDQNLSQVNENLGGLDEKLEDLNVKLEDLQEALDKRSVDADYTSFDETVWYLRASQPIFSGFTILNSYLRSRLTREMTEAELEYARLEVAKDIRMSFLNVLWAQEDLRSLQASVLRLESQLDAAQAFFRLGMKPWLGVLQAEVDLSEARQDLAQVENAVRVHTAKLLTLMGLPADTPLELAGRLESFQADFALSLRDCLAEARTNRPDLFIARKAVEVAEKDVHLAWGRFSPTASLDFAYNVQDRKYKDQEIAPRYDLSGREYWTLALMVNVNLFEGGRSQAMVMRARHEMFRIREQMLHQEMNAAYDVEAAFLVLAEAKGRIESSIKVREAAQEAYDMALVRYREEIGTHTELLDAQAQLTRSETRTNQARAEYNRARAQLYFAMGWLETVI